MTDRPSAADRSEAIARAKQLAADRTPTAARRRNTSMPSRILVTGAAASAGLVMIGAMASAAGGGTTSPPPPTETVVVVEVPTAEMTVVRKVRVLPAPPADPQPAPAATSGS